jgi:hypothetical protein
VPELREQAAVAAAEVQRSLRAAPADAAYAAT